MTAGTARTAEVAVTGSFVRCWLWLLLSMPMWVLTQAHEPRLEAYISAEASEQQAEKELVLGRKVTN
jgi:hypothetical protein